MRTDVSNIITANAVASLNIFMELIVRENKLATMSLDFAVDIIDLVKYLKTQAVNDKCISLRAILVASCKTAKENPNKE